MEDGASVARESLMRAGWIAPLGHTSNVNVRCKGRFGFVLAHIDQTGGTSVRVVDREFGGGGHPGVLLIVQLEGRGIVARSEQDGEPVTLTPGEALIVPDGPNLGYSSNGRSVRIEANFPVPSTEPLGEAVSGSVESSTFGRVVVSIILDVLNHSAPLTQTEWLHLRAGLWEFVSSLREGLRGRGSIVSARAREIYEDAVARILMSDPGEKLGVAELCAALHVSERYLRTVFTQHDDSPSAGIRRARVYQVLLALRDSTLDTPLLDDAFAVSIGYSGARQLRRDLRGVFASTYEQDNALKVALRALPAEIWASARVRVPQ